jgi:hypothetical protein
MLQSDQQKEKKKNLETFITAAENVKAICIL